MGYSLKATVSVNFLCVEERIITNEERRVWEYIVVKPLVQERASFQDG